MTNSASQLEGDEEKAGGKIIDSLTHCVCERKRKVERWGREEIRVFFMEF